MPTFQTRGAFAVGDTTYTIERLHALRDVGPVDRLPYSLKVLLENLVRRQDDDAVADEDIVNLVNWDASAMPSNEIAFAPARVLLQDFTGVPAVVDLAAMRDAMANLGGDPAKVNPLVPAELVIDHSVIVERFGTSDAFQFNADIEFERNKERYELLRWGQDAFTGFRVVPPDTGICHQVNLEYLSRVVFVDDNGNAYPDTLVGTDSHTPMVNGLGVLGWGVGGIEAEAALLGIPISMLVPRVVGFKLTGTMPAGTTATDLVLTIAERLRAHGVVGKIVEFYGPGIANVSLENRATIGNMSPEYGSTATMFPIDAETLRYLAFTGRPAQQIALVEAYAKEQGLWLDPDAVPDFSETLELDLGTVVPSMAGPTRPQDRVSLNAVAASLGDAIEAVLPSAAHDIAHKGRVDAASDASFPASDPPKIDPLAESEPVESVVHDDGHATPSKPTPVTLSTGDDVALDHGHVIIAAITSCTNTSNPSVMLAAGLLARNAVARGLTTKPWVKTSLAPGSRVVIDYYERAGLMEPLEALGFNLVGFGCTTCIGNSGPVDAAISAVSGDLALGAVLSGNRNFEGRINPDVRLNYLASPPLVVAYALVGSLTVDLTTEPIGYDPDGKPVMLAELWPDEAEVTEVIRTAIQSDMFRTAYDDVYKGDERWRSLPEASEEIFRWDPSSTYVHNPPFFEGMTTDVAPLHDIAGARVLAKLGDSVTTDHISPAGSIKPDSPAGQWLSERGVERQSFNSYGSRRGNHEVMIRGTFANIRLRNLLAPGTEGGMTRFQPSDEEMSIFDASRRYIDAGVPLIVLAGKEYGSGSSRDWAAKGTSLLGVKAVIAQSYERIHRSNLIGMGVLPLEFPEGSSADTLGLTGKETYAITGIVDGNDVMPRTVTVSADDVTFSATVRIDTPTEAEYFRNGGILQYALRKMLTE